MTPALRASIPERFGYLLFVKDDQSTEASHAVNGTRQHEALALNAADYQARRQQMFDLIEELR